MMHGRRNKCPCNWSIKKQIVHFSPLLKQLNKLKNGKQQKHLIKQNNPECLTKFLSECSGAILREDIKLPSYSQLKKVKQPLIHLANPSLNLQSKTKALTKKGGFLALLPILGGIIANTLLPLIINKFTKSK
jgi:hypothetical protein